MNASLISRIDSIISSSKSADTSSSTYLQNQIGKLKSGLGYVYEEKKFAPGEQPNEDHMIVSLLSQVVKAVKEDEEKSGKTGDEQGRTERIVKTLEWHKKRLLERQEEIKKEKVDIDIEQRKWITSEDIKDGWDSKTVSTSSDPRCRSMLNSVSPLQIVSSTPTAQPKPTPSTSSTSSNKKTKQTTIETLNSPGVQAAQAVSSLYSLTRESMRC